MIKKKKLFTLQEQFKGEVSAVGLLIKDITVGKEEKGCVVSITIKKTSGINIEATLALDDNKDFKNHIISMVNQALLLKAKEDKKKDGKK